MTGLREKYVFYNALPVGYHLVRRYQEGSTFWNMCVFFLRKQNKNYSWLKVLSLRFWHVEDKESFNSVNYTIEVNIVRKYKNNF